MNDVDLIKQKIDIVSLISEYVPLKKTGANFKGLCPFHSEKTPSFIVSPERQIWHCFGGCQIGGDIFKFFMKVENLEFFEALKILAKRAGVTLSSYAPSKDSQIKERVLAANHLASEFYAYLLTSHPLGGKARDYLAQRKISDSSRKLFGLGYAPNSWDSLISFLTKKGFSGAELEVAGLVSKSGIGHYFDRFRSRLIFTLRNHRGEVVGFSGRLMDPMAKEAKYINTAETPVYVKGDVLYALDVTKEEIKRKGLAVVVEGEIDTIQSYQAGVRNVVAIKGSALTAGHVALLKRYTENVYLSLDADFAGDAAAHRGIEMADQAGLNIKVVTFSEAKDPDDLIKKNPGLWRKAIEGAVNFYDYIIDSALTKYDRNKPEEAKKIVAEVAKFIAPIENLVVRNHYLKKLATSLGIPTDDLETQLGKEVRKLQVGAGVGNRAAESQAKAPGSRSEVLEEYLLSIFLQSKRPSDYLLLISSRLTADDFTNPVLGKIYQLLLSLVEDPGSDVSLPTAEFTIGDFVKVLPAELVETVDRLFLMENKVDFEEDAAVLAELSRTAWEVRELSLREKLKKIGLEIKKSSSEELENEFLEMTGRLQKLIEEKQLLAASA